MSLGSERTTTPALTAASLATRETRNLDSAQQGEEYEDEYSEAADPTPRHLRMER